MEHARALCAAPRADLAAGAPAAAGAADARLDGAGTIDHHQHVGGDDVPPAAMDGDHSDGVDAVPDAAMAGVEDDVTALGGGGEDEDEDVGQWPEAPPHGGAGAAAAAPEAAAGLLEPEAELEPLAPDTAAAADALGDLDLQDDNFLPLDDAVGDAGQDVEAAAGAAAAAADLVDVVAGVGGDDLDDAINANEVEWEQAAEWAAEEAREHERRRLAGEDAALHPWRAVAHEPVRDGVRMTVLQAAFNHLDDARRGVPLVVVSKQIREQVEMFGGNSAPDNPRNRYPPSLYICRLILGVSDLDAYEQHLCPGGCVHVFPHLRKREWKAHADRACECASCRCPCCGASRWERLDGGKVQPALRCYFLDDALQMFFKDPVWTRHVEAGRGRDDAAFWRTPSGQRVSQALRESGTTDEVRCLTCMARVCTSILRPCRLLVPVAPCRFFLLPEPSPPPLPPFSPPPPGARIRHLGESLWAAVL